MKWLLLIPGLICFAELFNITGWAIMAKYGRSLGMELPWNWRVLLGPTRHYTKWVKTQEFPGKEQMR